MSSVVSGCLLMPSAWTTASRATPPIPTCRTSPLSGHDSCARKTAAGAHSSGGMLALIAAMSSLGIDSISERASELDADILV